MERYTLRYLKSLPTIRMLHFDDVKIETETIRVLLSRMIEADGLVPYNNKVTVLEYKDGKWETIDEYKALGYIPVSEE